MDYAKHQAAAVVLEKRLTDHGTAIIKASSAS